MENSVREEGNSHESSNQEKVMAEAEVEGEAVIISEVEKLESVLVDKASIDQGTKRYAEKIIDEVKMIVDKLRNMKLEEKRKLKHLISDVVEDVGDAHFGACMLPILNKPNVVEDVGDARSLIEVKNEGFRARSLSILRELKAVKDVDDAHRLIEVYNDFVGARMRSILREFKTINEGFHQLLQKDGVGEGDEDVVGLEEDVKLLLQNMKSITSIIGYDGFGKTTLARQLYNHANVVKKFNRRAWVNCFDILGRRELLKNLIQQVADTQPKDVEEMDGQGLQNMLRQQLQGTRYFIVLDNFWSTSCLEFLQQALPPQGNLLLTCTEDKNDAFDLLVDYTYETRPLDESNSWKLLLKTIFNTSAHEFPKRLERKGKQMLMKHTDGVPFAIKDVGMEWAEKRRLEPEWEDVIESRDLELRASLGALESSFYPYLDPDEKSCFRHIGLFKDTTIKPQKFKQTWFASRGRPLSVKQVLGKFAEDVIFRKVRINKSAKTSGNKYYQVGAIFHKLSIKKVKEGNNRASHRVIYCSRERANCPTDQDERLICLFFNGGGCFDASPSYWKCFEQLRVLDLEGFGLKVVPETVGELIELRYLGLRNNYIKQLPSSLGCLKNLEVLDIALNFMVEVPDIIWEMEALVHLYMSDIFSRKPLRIEALKNLQTLTYISVDNWTYEVSGLQMMTSLRKLGIEELDETSNVSKLFASLAAMEYLECLELRGSRFRSIPSLEKLGLLRRLYKLKLYGLRAMLPKAENFPPFLREMSLVNSYFDEDPMPVLEKLSALLYLKLQNTYTGQQMVISEGGFPELEQLYIRELWSLRNIQVGRGSLHHLIRLKISNCPCLHLPMEFTVAAKNKKLDLFSERPYLVVDYQP